MKKKINRPVLRYHGGKYLLAPWIISHFPKHKIYAELFGGADSVLMQKEISYAEIYNDKWDTVVNVFEVLRNKQLAEQLEYQLRHTPFARTEFDLCGEIDISKIKDPVEKARRTIFRSFAGFGSASTNNKYATGFRANAMRSGTTPAYDWKNYANHIKSFTERLQGVIIEKREYQQIIDNYDTKETLFYADPPYMHSTRNMKRGNASYVHEMTDSDHIEMAEKLKKAKGMVVVSGYDTELYNQLFSGWKKFKKKWMADGARERIEVLWVSPNCITNKNLKLFD